MLIRDRIRDLRRVPASELRPNPKNWRLHPEAQAAALRGVLAEVGIADAVLARELEDGTLMLIDGHLRAETLGDKPVPVLVLDVNEAEADKILATLDPLAAMAEADAAKLDAIIREIDTGSAAVQQMLADLADSAGLYQVDPAKIVEDEVPAPPADPVTKPGDLWILGRHRLLCGDATRADDVARLMAGELADLWLTDPPYNVAYVGGTEDALTIANDSMPDAEFRAFLYGTYQNAFAVLQPGGSFYIWHADSEGLNFRGAVHDCGQRVRQCLIWKKNALVLGRQDYQWKHEPCLYGWKEGAAHDWFGDRSQTTVLEFDRPKANAEHPTMKPVAMIAYLIGNSCRPEGLVLDSFLGSGTTLVAAEQLDRRCYGLELDPRYCDVIVKRWEKLTGKTACLSEAGPASGAILETAGAGPA
jgi:site-specific DNA-methyltransferase (adenine-specific)